MTGGQVGVAVVGGYGGRNWVVGVIVVWLGIRSFHGCRWLCRVVCRGDGAKMGWKLNQVLLNSCMHDGTIFMVWDYKDNRDRMFAGG